jgi:hypothetical protein
MFLSMLKPFIVFLTANKKKPNHFTGQAFDVIPLLLQVFLLLFIATDTGSDATQNGFQSVISIIL